MQPPPMRPRGVTFAALACGVLGAALASSSILLLGPTRALFPGPLGLLLGTSLVAANVALITGAIGMWWLREWGRRLGVTGLALRAAHDLAFALHPAQASTRGPYLVGVVVYLALLAYLVKARPAFR